MRVKSLFLVIFLISCNVKTVGNVPNEAYGYTLDDVSSYNNIVSNFNNITEKMNIIINDYDNICGLKDEINFNEQASINLIISNDEFNKFVDDISFNELEEERFIKLETSLKELVLTLKPLYREYEKTIMYYKDKNDDFPPLEYLHKSFLKKYNSFKSSYNEFSTLLWSSYESSKIDDQNSFKQLNLTITSYMSKVVQALDETNIDFNSVNKLINKLKNFSSNDINNYFVNDYQKQCFNKFREKAYELQTELKNKDLQKNRAVINNYRDELVILYNEIVY